MVDIDCERMQPGRVDIDGLVAALSFYPDSAGLHDHAFNTVADENPTQMGELVIRLAAHDLVELRLTAASRLDEMFKADPEIAIELWRRLLQDDDPSVAQMAMETLQGMDDKEDLPMEILVQLGRFGTEMARATA